MIIDFHTHIFPEKIAARALASLSSTIHAKPCMDGTILGLLASMEESGIDLSVILPVVTDLRQFDSILRFADRINETYADRSAGGLISLAGMHPSDENYKEHLALIKKEGFAGIKIHPNYQGIFFSDIRYKRMLSAASELGLFVLTHTGYDPYTPDTEYCTPDMILEVIKDVAPPKLVLAHMGSNEYYEEAEEKLCGQNVYLDTAYSILHLTDETLVRMIRRHGTDKVLFATDCPWAEQKACVQKLKGCGLTKEELQKLFCENARSLLGLS